MKQNFTGFAEIGERRWGEGMDEVVIMSGKRTQKYLLFAPNDGNLISEGLTNLENCRKGRFSKINFIKNKGKTTHGKKGF